MQQRGWEQVDFVYLTGDAYVDHPSFGTAIISRLLESRGYRVGIVHSRTGVRKASGIWRTASWFSCQCRKYGFHGEPLHRFQKHRQKDSYSPGGEMGLRPDMPTVVYSNLIRQTYKHTPIILGGSRQAFDASHTMIIGKTRCAAVSFWIQGGSYFLWNGRAFDHPDRGGASERPSGR